MFTEPVWSKGTNQEIWGRVTCFCICPENLFDSESTNHLEERNKMSTISFGSVSLLRLCLLRFYSTDPCFLGLKELAHTVISWFEFLPCSPEDSSAEQARGVVSGILSGKLCLDYLTFNPRNSHLERCVWYQLIHSVIVWSHLLSANSLWGAFIHCLYDILCVESS